MKLRPYQEHAIQRVREEMSRGKRRALLVIATGGGKTVTAGRIILNAVAKGKRCIFLAHRKELIDQCSKTLDILGVDHGVIKSKHPRRDLTKPVQVASIQTLIKRDHWHADLIVIDEAHRSYANTYKSILERYGDSVALLGLSATPYRMDGKPLGDIYNSLIEVVETQELIDDGYLVEPSVFGAKNIDLSNVGVGARGDFKESDIAMAMSSTILHGELLTNWARICGDAIGADTIYIRDGEGIERVSQTNCDVCTVIFAPNVKKSIEIIEQFKAAGVRAEHLDGNAKPAERQKILDKLESGKLSVVSNVNILTEGWDLPRLECIIGARPTRSRSLYKQMGGRLMRPDDNSRIKFLLDHANWTRMHGFLSEPTAHSLTEPEKRPRKKKSDSTRPLKECPQCKSVHPLGTSTCLECGYEWPKKEYQFTDENLVQLDAKMVSRADSVPQNERQETFNRLASACVEKGHKPNWARVRYNSIYGEWPCKQSGITMPSFFSLYEKNINKKLNSQMIAQAAADAING